MSKKLCAGERAELYLATHPGFENRICYGDLFRALRLPEGTALQQRLNDRVRQSRKKHGKPTIRTWYENRQGAVRTAFYWMTKTAARSVLREYEQRSAQRAKKEAA